jgi:hypothetical protein
MDIGGVFPGVFLPGPEAYHSRQTVEEVDLYSQSLKSLHGLLLN